MIRSIAPQADETILEIGPGRGVMTTRLTASAGHVIAFEIDRDLSERLRQTAPANLTIIEGDFLDVTPDRVAEALARAGTAGAIRIAGNLPYNVASPILFKLIEIVDAGVPLMDATVMLQREVAERLVAVPGTRDYGVLTALIGHRATVHRVLQLPAGAFRPAPKVQSSIVRLRFHDAEPPVADPRIFAALTQAMFTRRRKTLANALQAYPAPAEMPPAVALRLAGIVGTRRPETLTIAEIARLADVYASAVL